MFSKLSAISFVALLAVATAIPTEPASQCNTGPVQCCQSTSTSSDATTAALLTSVGAVVQGVAVPIGVTCSPITAVGVGSGATCDSDPVCCSNNSFNGVVAIGCTPVDLSLRI